MSANNSRREFLLLGGATAVGAGFQVAAQGQPPNKAAAANDLTPGFDTYSRWKPTYGGRPDADLYLGKLVQGLRAVGEPPVEMKMPDLPTLPFKMIGGVKEFELRCTPVKREFLPGYAMDVWGYNDTMPGPLIEAVQGDRVRFIVHNELPEPTTIHWHGLELPVQFDGVPELVQDPIMPGKSFVYEFDLHQTGTFFYHSHFPMQEAFGMVGGFIIHPKVAFDPPVDRDFLLIFQNFHIDPNQTIPDSMAMDWNWHTINGRSGPFTTPLVVKHGERIRVRLLDFSPMQHHPIHLHGHTFWETGHEGARIPSSAWVPRNNVLVGVAQATDFEFIASNPGDWIFHCHMVHHMMNHMVEQVGPRIRKDSDVADYQSHLAIRPEPRTDITTNKGFQTPGYPQKMQNMMMPQDMMQRIMSRKEVRGMRMGWAMGVMGLMTVMRVLPPELFDLVMNGEHMIKPGAIFDRIVKAEYSKDYQEK
jgi:FtsP/CotA-like multicopper oxidase with cupredoxin domain